MKKPFAAAALALCLSLGACNGTSSRYPATTQGLALSRVVLYRNGVGYFERRGEVDGKILRLKVRKDQVNDLLKSLTIVDRKTGQALSVSMPLDPTTWANLALATLGPGNGSLAQVIDSLRGMEVELATTQGSVSGRIVMVERIENEPDPSGGGGGGRRRGGDEAGTESTIDHKVTLMDAEEMRVVRLSKVQAVVVKDGDLALQFHRRLDAAAGEGMFQQVEVSIRLDGKGDHDLVVSYVVAAPMWKPTYRVVLPEGGKGKALLQAWAVVDNTSGEDWSDVELSLTAGAPIAFKYDLHTPREVDREDLSHSMTSRQARVALGETTFEEKPPGDAPAPEEAGADRDDGGMDKGEMGDVATAAEASIMAGAGKMGMRGPMAPPASRSAPSSDLRRLEAKKNKDSRGRFLPSGAADEGMFGAEPQAAPAISVDSLRRSTLAQARAAQASGLTRFDLKMPVTVPDSTSTMVAIVNQEVDGEETFLFRPGGAGAGFENNPYRVVRFRNTTPFVLESGPIAIYSGGSFVGEGISETVGSNTSATIPFAVEPGIMVQKESKSTPEELSLTKIVRGIIHVERFHQVTTLWTARAQTMNKGFTVLVRHPRQGPEYKLKERPEGTEDLPDAFLVPLKVVAGKLSGSIELVEQTPSQTTISIWDGQALGLLERLVVATNVTEEQKLQLRPVLELRREIGGIDTEMEGLRRQQEQNDRRVALHQRTLEALARDKSPEAARMKVESEKALSEFQKEGDRLARELIRLEGERTRKQLKLETMLEGLTITPKK